MYMRGPLIINDPVYGFTRIPRGLLTEIIAHPCFQRLGRIRQLGMSTCVYPGAQHTRKQHSIGAFHLIQEALNRLQEKGHFIFDSEIEAVEAAILLHDVGHGPFSHVLEKTFMKGITHEEISLLIMNRMNEQLHGGLSLAINIFEDKYPKRFLHELICSQLDVDRLDYLCRDSFFCGVCEGNIGVARIIEMLDIIDDKLVVDVKGLYSVENYLMSRRMMYWQVYLHKTAVAAEEVLRAALRRAKYLVRSGKNLFASPSLLFFLMHEIPNKEPDWLDYFLELEDNDIMSALKVWMKSDDKILAMLCSDFINRRLFKVDVYAESIPKGEAERLKQELSKQLELPLEDMDYFVTWRKVQKELYSVTADGIGILYPDGEVRDFIDVSNIVRSDIAGLSDEKFYVFRQRME